MPNVGPIDGWRMAITLFLPRCLKAWPRPTVVVVLPSPKGVGVIAETTTYFAFGLSLSSSTALSLILARLSPYGSIRCGPMPIWAAMSSSGCSVAAWAMSRSDGKPISDLLLLDGGDRGRCDVEDGVVEERRATTDGELPGNGVGNQVEGEHVQGG